MVRRIQRDKANEIRKYDSYNNGFYGQQRRILSGLALVAAAPLHNADKYLKIRDQKIDEAKRPYPNRDFIRNCYKVMVRLLPNLVKVYPELVSRELQEYKEYLEQEMGRTPHDEQTIAYLNEGILLLKVEQEALIAKQQIAQQNIPEK